MNGWKSHEDMECLGKMGAPRVAQTFHTLYSGDYDVGNYPVSTMFSYELVADGNYHTVEILAIKKNCLGMCVTSGMS